MAAFLYAFVAASGFLGTLVAASLFFRFRRREAALFIGVDLSLLLFILPALLPRLGFPLDAGAPFGAAVYAGLNAAGFFGTVASCLFFFSAVFPAGLPLAGRFVRPFLIGAAALLDALVLFLGLSSPLRYAVIAVLYASGLWCIAVGFAGRRAVPDRRHRRPLTAMLVVYAVGLPFMVLDSLVPEVFVTLPLFYLFLNVFGLWSVLAVLMERTAREGAFDPTAYGLSPREAEVSALLASGASTARIAEALFVSEKTVETHLSRIYRKTGVRGRYEFIALVSGSANQGKP